MIDRRRSRRPAAADWEPVRWPVEIAAWILEAGSCWLPVTLLDLSADGCRMWAGFRMRPGRAARLRVDGFNPFAGRIDWSEDWHAGVHFDAPIHPSVLHHLVGKYRAPRDADALIRAASTAS